MYRSQETKESWGFSKNFETLGLAYHLLWFFLIFNSEASPAMGTWVCFRLYIAVLYSIVVLTCSTLYRYTAYKTERVNLWECIVYLYSHGWIVAAPSYKPVKADFDGAAWLCLNDPLTTQGVFVVAWPPRGEDDTRRPWVVASTRS